MDAIIGFIAQLPAYLLDHPALLVVVGLLIVALIVGVYRSTKG